MLKIVAPVADLLANASRLTSFSLEVSLQGRRNRQASVYLLIGFHHHQYIVKQLRGLVAFIEEQTKKKMDYDRLRELVKLSDKTWNLIEETYDLRKAVPCPMGTGDAMNTMVPINFMMATPKAYDFFIDLKKELEEKIAKGEGEVENEKYRLMWGGGLPAWYALSDFNYFNNRGASLPAERTYRMVAPLSQMDLPETKDPIEHLAWRWLGYWTFWYDKAKKRPGSEPDVDSVTLPPATLPVVPIQSEAAARQAVRGVLEEYRTAFESLNAEAIRAVQPGVDVGSLQANFGSVTAYNVRMQVQDIAFDGPSVAWASCLMTYSPVPKPSGKIPPVPTVFHLRRSGEVWLIEKVVRK